MHILFYFHSLQKIIPGWEWNKQYGILLDSHLHLNFCFWCAFIFGRKSVVFMCTCANHLCINERAWWCLFSPTKSQLIMQGIACTSTRKCILSCNCYTSIKVRTIEIRIRLWPDASWLHMKIIHVFPTNRCRSSSCNCHTRVSSVSLLWH